MAKGASLIELAVVLAVVAVLAAVALPRVADWQDRLAADRAAREVTTALAVTRHTAILRSVRARLVIAADSLRIERWEGGEWRPARVWGGPAEHGVALEVSNPVVVFGPTGVGLGLSNTSVVLRRGSHVEKITTSRVGRVKRW